MDISAEILSSYGGSDLDTGTMDDGQCGEVALADALSVGLVPA